LWLFGGIYLPYERVRCFIRGTRGGVVRFCW
jgi:hypothetical protein